MSLSNEAFRSRGLVGLGAERRSATRRPLHGSFEIQAGQRVASCWEMILIRNRISFLRTDLDVVPFARRLLEEGFAALTARQDKDSWDWYYLGICHEFGRGTPVNHGKAAECFRTAKEAGNPYAEYEEIWSAYLSPKSQPTD